MSTATESAEDDSDAGGRALADLDLEDSDAVVGISASGRTPYVLGAIESPAARARSRSGWPATAARR